MSNKERRWMVLGVTYIAALAPQVTLLSLPPLFPVLSSAWGVTTAQLGFLMAIFGIGIAVSALPWTLVLPRIGLKKVGMLSLSLLLVGSGICLIFPNYNGLLAGQIFGGIAYGAALIYPMSIVPLWFSAGEYGRAYGCIATIFPVSCIVAFTVDPILVQYGIMTPYLLVFIWSLIGLVLWLTLVKIPSEERKGIDVDLHEVLVNRNVWMVAYGWAAFAFFLFSLLGFVPMYLVKMGSFSLRLATLLALLPLAMMIWNRPIYGFLSDKIGKKKLLVPSLLLQFLLALAIPLIPFEVIYWVVYLSILGIVMGPMSPCTLAGIASILKSEVVGIGMGCLNFAAGVAICLGPIITGYLIPFVGWPIALTLSALPCALGVITDTIAKIP